MCMQYERLVPEGGCFHAAGVLTETTAELAASLTFAAARRVVEADRYMRKGLYLGWAPTLMVGQLLQVRQLPASLADHL